MVGQSFAGAINSTSVLFPPYAERILVVVFGFYCPPDQTGNLWVVVIAGLVAHVLGQCSQCIVIEWASLGSRSTVNRFGFRCEQAQPLRQSEEFSLAVAKM